MPPGTLQTPSQPAPKKDVKDTKADDVEGLYGPALSPSTYVPEDLDVSLDEEAGVFDVSFKLYDKLARVVWEYNTPKDPVIVVDDHVYSPAGLNKLYGNQVGSDLAMWTRNVFKDYAPHIKRNDEKPKSPFGQRVELQAQIESAEDEAVKLIEDEQDKMKEDEVPEIDMDLAVGRRFPGMEDKVAVSGDRPEPQFRVGDVVTISNRDPTHQFVVTKLAWARQIDEWFYTLLPHKGGPNYSPHPITGMLQSTQVPEYALTKIG